MKLTVLVIGAGGREHALALALSRDPAVAAVHVAPGNPGTWELDPDCGNGTVTKLGGDPHTAALRRDHLPTITEGEETPWVAVMKTERGTTPVTPALTAFATVFQSPQRGPVARSTTELWAELSALDPLDGAAVVRLARELDANLVVIGPEAPLVAGVADQVRAAGIACFGPGREAARLEGSKQFAKEVMAEAGVPTARSYFCRTLSEAEAALDEFGAPYVVKNDHLAAGKGVVVTTDRAAALAHAQACGEVVIEEYLDGPEVSLFAICDGTRALPLLAAQDFKRVGEGDTGPNTGGMGAYCPLPWVPDGLTGAVMDQVVNPTLAEMNRRGIPFQGLLYAGLALTSRGLRVVEFNARFGDPETEAILPLLISPLGQVLYAAATGGLDQIGPLTWEDTSSLTVIYAADGYPGTPVKGGSITLPTPPESVQVIQAGTGLDSSGGLVAQGGRVLAVTAQGKDLGQARDRAYAYLPRIDFPSGFYRPDIAFKAASDQIPTPSL